MPTHDLTCRSVSLRAASVNEADRSVEAVLATENQVTVFDSFSFRTIDEILLMWDVGLPKSMPLLNDHQRSSVNHVLGSARELRIRGDKLTGRLVFADGPPNSDEERAWQKVKAGHLTDVSIGYHVLDAIDISPGKTEEVGGEIFTAGERTLRISTKWKPFEVSVTPVGADAGSKIRSEGLAAVTAALKHEVERQAGPDLSKRQIIREMACCAEMEPSQVRKILNGEVGATPDDLDALAAVLGISLPAFDDDFDDFDD